MAAVLERLQTQQMPDYRITLPRLGIRVVAPVETQHNMSIAKYKQNNRDAQQHILWSTNEKTRLRLLQECSILAKRYPTRQEGERFMEYVDNTRREELLGYAYELSNHISTMAEEVNPSQKFAIILYGSVAKGLVRSRLHKDPSDIDLAVVGTFTPEEQEELYTKITKKRLEITQRILEVCPNSTVLLNDIRYAGVKIQHINRLLVNSYSSTINYIKSSATPLYDPHNIWGYLENRALQFASTQYERQEEQKKWHNRGKEIFNRNKLP